MQQVHGDELTLAQMFSSANPNAREMMRRGSFDIDAIAAAKEKKSGRISQVFKKGKARGKSILSNLTGAGGGKKWDTLKTKTKAGGASALATEDENGTSQEESSDWALGGVHHGNSSTLKTIGGSAGVTVKFDPGRQTV